MTPRRAGFARHAGLGAACGVSVLCACLSERPRPAPPVLGVTLAQATVHSPDTLTGSVSAQDPDGLDSIWVSVDAVRVGEDGLLAPSFERAFRFAIRAGHVPGDRVPVVVEARDVAGFKSALDTGVTVAP